MCLCLWHTLHTAGFTGHHDRDRDRERRRSSTGSHDADGKSRKHSSSSTSSAGDFAFMLYCRDAKPRFKERHPEITDKKEISRRLTKKWKALSDDERAAFSNDKEKKSSEKEKKCSDKEKKSSDKEKKSSDKDKKSSGDKEKGSQSHSSKLKPKSSPSKSKHSSSKHDGHGTSKSHKSTPSFASRTLLCLQSLPVRLRAWQSSLKRDYTCA